VEYYDDNGPGMCCPDYVMKINGQVVILECKLTDCQEAYSQLGKLYIPVFTKMLGYAPQGIVVVKNLARGSATPCHSITEALASGKTVHWLGKTPLL